MEPSTVLQRMLGPRARRRAGQLAALAAALGLAGYAAWPWLPWARGAPVRTIVFYGFSILGEVMNQSVFPAFQQVWHEQTGEHVEFITSFAGSGTLTNQIILGVPAEVALLSLELDALRLVEAGVLPGPTWRDLPFEGVVNRTPFVILVRAGNPLEIGDFADLTRFDVGVVHPDPLTSGGAQWAILAEYGSELRRSGDADRAYAQLLGIWRNVVAQSSSARGARTQFESGFGDALITYEQEILYDLGRGRLQGAMVIPQSTILSEHTLVVIERNIPEGDRALVQAFVDFLWSEQAQRLFLEYGFRSVYDELNAENPALGVIADPFTVGDLGGWAVARRTVIDEVWRARVLVEVVR